MFRSRPEIDSRTIKLIIGVIALSLAPLTSALSPTPIDSISASYDAGGWAQSIFIGFLFAIASFLLAYNGRSDAEMALGKLAALAALGVALFPCTCGSHAAAVPGVHAAAATVMFGVLALFCRVFYRRARAKGHPQALARAGIYAACGFTIALAIAVLALDAWLGHPLLRAVPRLVLHGEATALTAFGISWLTASHTLPWLNRESERFAPWRLDNPRV